MCRGWTVETSAGVYRSRRLVVASSYNQAPHVPTWPGQEVFSGTWLHSREYRSGVRFRNQHVLVVGIGNTGAEIALDLVEHGAASTTIAVRGPVHVSPRDPFGIPAQRSGILLRHAPEWLSNRLGLAVSRHYYGDLKDVGLRRPETGPITLVRKKGRIPLIDIGTIEQIRKGNIQVAPGIERVTTTGVRFVGGEERAFDAVVLATGYRANLESWLTCAPEITDDRGYPRSHGEEVCQGEVAGLYFLGFANPVSGALREIHIEAKRIARHIGTVRLRAVC